MEAATAEVPVPPQVTAPVVYDFRGFSSGPKGYRESRKRKLDEYAEQVAEEQAAMPADGPALPTGDFKRPKHNAVGQGKASGRPWKAAGERASSVLPSTLKSSWADKMAAKAAAGQFRDHKRAVKAARGALLEAERKRREAVKSKKEENRKKSMVVQKVTKASTIKRMMKSKKQRKLLVTADTN